MLQPKKIKFEYLFEKSYLKYIDNSVGTKMFQTFYVKKNGKVYDVLNKGELSCAFYASTVLRSFGLIRKLHFTVAKTVKDLLASGGKKVPLRKIKPGDVLIWEPTVSKDPHNHIGFYLGGGIAVSNNEKKRLIVRHDWNYNNKRNVEFAIRPFWKKTYVKS